VKENRGPEKKGAFGKPDVRSTEKKREKGESAKAGLERRWSKEKEKKKKKNKTAC